MNYQEILDQLIQININNQIFSQFVKNYVAFCDWWAFFHIFWASAFVCILFYFVAYFYHNKDFYNLNSQHYYFLSAWVWALALFMSYVNIRGFNNHLALSVHARKNMPLHLQEQVLPKLKKTEWTELIARLRNKKPLRDINSLKEINSMSFYAWSIPFMALVAVSLIYWFQVRKNQIYCELPMPGELPDDLQWQVVSNIVTIHVFELVQMTLAWLLSVLVLSLLLSWIYPDAALLYYFAKSHSP